MTEDSGKYVVYFTANSCNCSGWLRMKNTDLFCFDHFMKWADRFDTEEKARAAADVRRSECRKVEDEINGEIAKEYEKATPWQKAHRHVQPPPEKCEFNYTVLKIV